MLSRDRRFHVPLDGGRLLPFPLLGRLLVEFAAAQLREHTGLLAGALEATQRGVEILVLADTDAGHSDLEPRL